MDLAHRFHFAGLGGRVALRVRALPSLVEEKLRLPRPSLSRLQERYRPALNALQRLKPAFWLGAAALLGIWAHGQARLEALSQWLRANPPSQQVWVHALGARGLAPVKDPANLQRVFRTLPAGVEESAAVWATSDLRWIAVYQSGDATLPGSIYCDDCRGKPAAWEPAGIGWAAYEKLIPRIDAALAARKSSNGAGKPHEFADPREIRY
jgi:hypothetical protein